MEQLANRAHPNAIMAKNDKFGQVDSEDEFYDSRSEITVSSDIDNDTEYIDLTVNEEDGDVDIESGMAARLSAPPEPKIGRFVLRSSDQLLQADKVARGDILSLVKEHTDLSEEEFLACVISKHDWNTESKVSQNLVLEYSHRLMDSRLSTKLRHMSNVNSGRLRGCPAYIKIYPSCKGKAFEIVDKKSLSAKLENVTFLKGLNLTKTIARAFENYHEAEIRACGAYNQLMLIWIARRRLSHWYKKCRRLWNGSHLL